MNQQNKKNKKILKITKRKDVKEFLLNSEKSEVTKE
jgi:hypothetical protein